MVKPPTVPVILDRLEAAHGPQVPLWPTNPYEFLVWWHCGYPQSDDRCAKGWAALAESVGITPAKLLRAAPAKLIAALKLGGMVPELRAQRLKEIAMRVQDQLAGELDSALSVPLAEARKLLKGFPNIADPGADRILLFAGISPIAAVPSNCPHVLVRILQGREHDNYGRTYREAQSAIESGTSPKLDARQRAYLLLKRHGQEICKRNKPKCDACPLASQCAYRAGHTRGRAAATR